ncbi:MAG: helix-turn-helix domain-containing protein [Gammaproteobacteria bacterium]|nr:helix-turn-helix domain-containing protein [Gammaproteobacteria bacterium]MYF03135.1 helix-turn-helix domain-containing protein [Gammaproteobacteria bacterium]
MNASDQEQQATETTSASFGERIQQARESRQLSIDDLVGETRINPQHLIDLEEGKTSGISAPGYIVGYLRTLAKVLELDAEELINDFKSSTNQSQHQTIDPEHELLPPKQKKNSLGWSTIVATSIIVLAGVGALIYYWLEIAGDENSNSSQSEIVEDESSELDNSEQANPAPSEERNKSGTTGQPSRSADGDLDSAVSTSANSTEDDTAENLDASENEEEFEDPTDMNGTSSSSEHTSTDWEDLMNLTQLAPGDESVDNDSELPQEDSSEVDESSQETADTEETEEATQEEPTLLFEFSDDSYIEVTDADDNQLVSEIKQAGTKLELDGTAPFTIKLGSARSVTLFYQGDEVDLTPHTRRNIAELTLPP